MKITIIGCGYVGSALAIKLKKNGHHVTVTTRSDAKIHSLQSIADDVHILEGNDTEAVKRLLASQEAVILSVAADSQDAYESTYLGAAKAIAEACEEAPNLSQIIYTGSTSVYGDHQGKIVNEETPTSPDHPTGKILLATEEILLKMSSKQRNVCIFRLGEIYGPNRQIADRLRRMNGKSLAGNGNSVTNLIHLDDIVEAILFTLNRNLNGIYNLCNDKHVTRKELYTQICQEEEIPEMTWDSSLKSIHSGNKLVSNNKIKACGFQFNQG